MTNLGTSTNPLRVAIFGSGPAGFYAADHLLKQKDVVVEVDMFDRLPTPFGLVRGGVAPDHQKIKSVTKAFERIAKKPNFRFYGYIEFGKDLSLEDIQEHYHQVVFATGAQTDRPLNIPGIDLKGSHPATEFVAWYNGHPDYRDLNYDLSGKSAAVIGIGNVAMDVARILCHSQAALRQTDIAEHALEALSKSNIKEVYILGRRGPAQAKFTNPEIRELQHMEETDVFIPLEDATLDPLSLDYLEKNPDRATETKVGIIQDYANRELEGRPRKLTIRFLVSPVELSGDENGRVRAMRLVHNELYATDAGTMRPRSTDRAEEIPVDLVFRSIGYRGVPLPGVPFNDSWGVILNDEGRILDQETQESIPGMYTAGWIKRGPSGVIGTNKPDSVATVKHMLEDLESGKTMSPSHPGVDEAKDLVMVRQPRYVTFDDWLRLDQMELARGEEQGRPRVKFTSVEEMLEALGR